MPGSGVLVTPKAGQESIPVYGRSYPEETAYPQGVPPQSITPIYDLPAGQIYVATDLVNGDYYWAPTFSLKVLSSDQYWYCVVGMFPTLIGPIRVSTVS